jgi:hypothetical protein
MKHVFTRGLVAGAAGTTALNAVTYVDMILRGRPASELPKGSMDEISHRLDADVPGDGTQRDNRLEGLGALVGITTGLATGLVASVLAPATRRLPLPVGAAVVGGLAMLSSDGPITKLGLTDPKQWSASDWVSDALPHLAYGLATCWAVRAA